jgi:HK97 family phage prohead protease
MPMKPHKGESQSDFMSRCVPDMIGTGDDKRPQDQAVAICMDIWRNKDKAFADPGYQSDGMERFIISSEDEVRAAWVNINKKKFQQPYTEAQVKRIKARITEAWKEKFGGEEPPEDEKAILRLRRSLVLAKQSDAPEPDDDESYDDFMGRCVSELTDDPQSMDDDEAEEACSLQWDESGKAAGPIMYKQRTTPSSGMTFVLSDATIDRFGDVVDPKGWVLDYFHKNPIALFNHDKGFVIGTWTNVRLGNDLRADLELAAEGTSPRIDEISRLIKANVLRAVSVGFRPLEDEPINAKDPWGGTRYNKQELVECSVVAVPAIRTL